MILLFRLYCFAIPRSLNQADCLKWVSIDLLKELNDAKIMETNLSATDAGTLPKIFKNDI